MGCTSSASNMASPQANSEKNPNILHETSEGKSMEEMDEVIYTDKENETNAINVLPTCDTLGEPTQLARKNKTFIDTSSVDLEKESHANGYVIENEDKPSVDNSNKTLDDLQTDDKISTLEEVVEKAVELYSTESSTDNRQNELNNVQDPFGELIQSEDMITETKPSEIDLIEGKNEYSEDIVSPSQSESSRATRWEALADIAAELPPSLTVDPVTGQIYALSK